MASIIPAGLIPSGSEFTSSIGSLLFWGCVLIIILIVLIGGIIGIYFLVRWIQYNKKLFIFEERQGKTEFIGFDNAKEIVYNIYGDSIFYLRKRKKFLPRGEVKIGKNKYLYLIKSDGEWVNCSLGTITEQLKEIGVNPIHPDMRAFKSGLAKLIRDRFEKKKLGDLLKEWAPIIVPIITLIIMLVGLYIVGDRFVAAAEIQNKGMTTSKEVMEMAKNVLSSLNNICSSSGIK